MNEGERLADEIVSALDNFAKDEHLGELDNRFEERMVERVMKFFGLDDLFRRVRRAHSAADRLITFDWFHSEYPSFPVRFGTSRIPYLHQVTRNDLRKRVLKTKLYAAYQTLVEAAGETNTCFTGLLTSWPGEGVLVFHDAVNLEVHGYRESWSFRRPEKPLFLDLLIDSSKRIGLLPAIAEIWRPTGLDRG